MMMGGARMIVRIRYVDGVETTAPPERWRELRADGVDWVEVDSARFIGKSVYWLYREDESWVAGCASFYADGRNPELVVAFDGSQTEREIEGAPDLRHEDVKLGWWRPGEPPE